MSLSPEALDSFINDVAAPRAVYFLGAGASAGIIRMARDIPPEIRKAVMEFGIYGTEGYSPNAFRASVGLTPYEPKHSWMESFRLSGTYNVAVEALWDAYVITPRDSAASRAFETSPPEYRYFDLVPKSTVIVTTNNDGLSRWARHRLSVFEIHGSIFEGRLGDEAISLPLRAAGWIKNHMFDMAQSAQEFGRRIGFQPVIVRPTDPVPSSLLRRWEDALRCLDGARSVILVGYSLPTYDSRVRDLFLDALRDRDVSIWVLAPDPFDVVGNLQELVRCRVSFLAARWDLLTLTVLRTARRRAARSLSGLRGTGSEIAHEYYVAWLAESPDGSSAQRSIKRVHLHLKPGVENGKE